MSLGDPGAVAPVPYEWSARLPEVVVRCHRDNGISGPTSGTSDGGPIFPTPSGAELGPEGVSFRVAPVSILERTLK